MKAIAGTISKPLISTFFMLKYLVFAYVGAVLLNVVVYDYEANLGLYGRPDLLLKTWFYSLAGLLLVPTGMLIANMAFHYQPQKTLGRMMSMDMHLRKADVSRYFYFAILGLLGIGCVTFWLYSKQISSLPLTGLFYGLEASDLAQLRSEGTNAFSGKLWRYTLIMKDLPLLLLVLVYLVKESSWRWKALFWLLMAYNLFVTVYDLQKGPIIKLLMVLLIAYFYKKRQINWRVIFVTATVIVGLLVVMYMFFMGMSGRNLTDILAAISHRIFITQIHCFYWWQLFQESHGYLYGASFPNPGQIFPFEYVNATVEVMAFAHPELASLGIVGTMPTAFFADWYLNFGPYMALFSMLLLGFIIQSVDICCVTSLARDKSLLMSAYYIYLIDYFGKFSTTGYQGIMIDEGWIFPGLMLLGIHLMRRIFPKLLNETFREKNITYSPQ